jgi:hypothetical protein
MPHGDRRYPTVSNDQIDNGRTLERALAGLQLLRDGLASVGKKDA